MSTETVTQPKKKARRGLVQTTAPRPALDPKAAEQVMLAANERPTALQTPATTPAAAPAPAVQAAAPAAPAAPAKAVAAPAPAPVQEPPAAAPAQAAAPVEAGEGGFPWDGLDPRLTQPVLLRMPAAMHMKMQYLSQFMLPHRSMQKLALHVLEQEFDKLIAIHYKPDNKMV